MANCRAFAPQERSEKPRGATDSGRKTEDALDDEAGKKVETGSRSTDLFVRMFDCADGRHFDFGC